MRGQLIDAVPSYADDLGRLCDAMGHKLAELDGLGRRQHTALAMIRDRLSWRRPAMSTCASTLGFCLLILLSTSGTSQGIVATDPLVASDFPLGRTMMQPVPYPNEVNMMSEVTTDVPSCYRIGRCSAFDLYRFRDRPNRLTRLAPAAPPDTIALTGWIIPHRWVPVPITPDANILPRYRGTGQVRAEYGTVGMPIEPADSTRH